MTANEVKEILGQPEQEDDSNCTIVLKSFVWISILKMFGVY